MKGLKALWIALAALVILSPLGLLASGTAWGEWGMEELHEMGLGFVPEGMERLAGLWSAPLPDYTLSALDERVAYVLSAVTGVALVVLGTWILGRLLAGRGSNGAS
jgi:hypothetical protein